MRRLAATALLLLALALAPAARAGTPPGNFNDGAVVSGLSLPTAVAFLPDGRLLVTEKGGTLKLVEPGSATALITLPVCTGSEMGLLGVAVDPQFSANGFVYLYRTKPALAGCGSATGRFNQVVRVTISGDAVDPGSLTELLTGIRTDNGNHDGGTVRIGPDGKLWVSTGDTGIGDGGAPGNSTNPYAQDPNVLEGKMLRLELSGAPAAGNPFIGQQGKRPEVYAYGFRNPFRFGFEPVTGRAWAGDVGQETIEELDIIAAGGNYAWPHCEGTLPAGCQQPGDIDPIFEYPQTGPSSLGRTIIGGAFAPQGFSFLAGDYFFADFGVSTIYRAVPNAARDDLSATPTAFVTGAGGPTDVVFGPDRALYYVAFNTGEVRKVTPKYARPKGATPFRVPLALAYRKCTLPNRTHGAPLVAGSCNPPAQESNFLTVGTLDSNNVAANAVGSVRLDVVPGDPATTPADEADVRLAFRFTDVRRRSDLLDYTGELQVRLPIRITDRDNPPSGGSGDSSATTSATSVSFSASCLPTADSAIGSLCTLSTTADATVPGVIKEEKRTIWELGQIEVLDGGPDGIASTAGNTLFAREGVFVP